MDNTKTVPSGIRLDWNEVIGSLHGEGVTICGLICVRRNVGGEGTHESFIQWINTDQNIQAKLLDAIKLMQPTGKIIQIA